jgi:hypothetical protein
MEAVRPIMLALISMQFMWWLVTSVPRVRVVYRIQHHLRLLSERISEKIVPLVNCCNVIDITNFGAAYR